MIAKGLLLFCLVGLSCATFLKKRQLAVAHHLPSVHTTYFRHIIPEVREYITHPVVHRVHQPVHVEKHIQPIVHHIYRQPLLRTSVERPVVAEEYLAQPVPVQPISFQRAFPFIPENIVNVQSQAQAQSQAHQEQAQAQAQAQATAY